MDKLKPPCEYFGFRPGEDRKLIDWIGITSYLTYLGRESDRIEKVDIGETTEGRLYYYLLITSPGNLQQLDKIKDIQGKLADPRKLTAEEESVLVEQGKTIVMITCSIHATEVGATQMTPELAFELATGSGPEIIEILDNVVLLLVPSLNPDGLDMVCQWYAKTVNSCYEGTAPPYLYHKYAGHDNNRDWFMLNLVETKLAVEKIHNVWHPQIVYDIHQMGEDGFRFSTPVFGSL